MNLEDYGNEFYVFDVEFGLLRFDLIVWDGVCCNMMDGLYMYELFLICSVRLMDCGLN